jgi:transcription elongation factor GreA
VEKISGGVVQNRMEEKEIYITAEGLEKLKIELNLIEGTKLKDIAKKIAEAKDLGDLAENSEYHEAKQEQAFLAGRAQDLRYKVKHARIISNTSSNGVVAVGANIKVKFNGQEMGLTLVGGDESDPANGKISVDSPIGKALVGHSAGDKVKVVTPSGETEYQIVEVK